VEFLWDEHDGVAEVAASRAARVVAPDVIFYTQRQVCVAARGRGVWVCCLFFVFFFFVCVCVWGGF
jgi:hypothetical protein